MCKLSVIIPVHNTETVLGRCVESVLNQGFGDMELLLIDDGSTDGSGMLCDAYAEKDPRVRVFHNTHRGVSAARNVGLDNASGEWVAFIDSDDFVDEGYFTLPFDPQCDLYVRNWCYANGQVAERFEPQTVDEQHYWSFMQATMDRFAFRTGCSLFFKRAMIDKNEIRFDERFHLGEDSLFVLDYVRQGTTLQIVEGPSYRYDRSEQWKNKYLLSWQEAENYLSTFVEKYDKLPVEVPDLANQIFGLFREMIDKNESHIHKKWLGSEPVKRFIETQLPTRGRLFRLKYWVKEMLKR